MRVLAISDLHVDYDQNMRWVMQLSGMDFVDDVLILAGDISDDVQKFKKALSLLRPKFSEILFVPGNHDLWVRRDNGMDSLEKFYQCLNICASLDIRTGRLTLKPAYSLTIQPIFSWYEKPEESTASLYFPKKGEDPSLGMWMDRVAIRWPKSRNFKNAQDFFYELTGSISSPTFTKTDVITFSHFLPRQRLIFPADYIPGKKYPGYRDPAPAFNFSRVAGSRKIDTQLRAMGSVYHIHGHQHRNRFRQIDGVCYLSHNLGYPKERKFAGIVDNAYFPELIWDSTRGFITHKEA